MFCTKYREICHKHGWTTTDNGSTVFVCKETEKKGTPTVSMRIGKTFLMK